MEIVLVASSNGLGHARRLLNLIPGLSSRGQSLKLFLTQSQAQYLNLEIRKIQKEHPFRLVFIGHHGIDGVHFRNFLQFDDPSQETIACLSRSDLVISDNSLWPADYSENFYLLGHFNWVDYYKTSKTQFFLHNEFAEKFEHESQLLLKCKTRFLIKDFQLAASGLSPTIEIPLLRYVSDKIKNRSRGSEIWIANGTTGQNLSTESFPLIDSRKIVHFESWKIHGDGTPPQMVFGRPGLGTIRDCLAAGTYFHPVWSGQDVELQSNVNHLGRLGLLLDSSSPSEFSDLTLERMNAKIKEFWSENSASPKTIADKIFSNLI